MWFLPPLILLLSLFGPPIAAVFGLALWTFSLRRAKRLPPFVVLVAYFLAALASVLVVVGAARAMPAIVNHWPGPPEEKARRLGETIGAGVHFSAPGFWLAIVGLLWLAFSTWRSRRNANRPGS